MRREFEVELVGGPHDGHVITLLLPPFVGGAPTVIRTPAEPVDGVVTAGHLQPGTLAEQYRAPAGDEELEAADAAYTSERPVKYRYDGQVTT